jgi:rubrerythrin
MNENFDFEYDPFDTQIQVEEIETNYDEWLDSLPPSKAEIDFSVSCEKCGELITDFEREVNQDKCPCCGSVLPFGIYKDEPMPLIDGEDIPL